ncbi:MAG TPA: hypothetical protein DEA71_05315 [Nitrospira sp.]|nr:hypothetical protein [Nitrospira sp.]
MPATPLLLLLATVLLASCSGDKHLPSSNPTEYDPKKAYSAPAAPDVVHPVMPPPSSPAKSPPMDAVALHKALQAADRTRDILEKVEPLDANAQLHAILEAMMRGEQAPPELRSTFMESFGPRKAMIHQVFDKQYAQLQQVLHDEHKLPATQPMLRKSRGSAPFSLYRVNSRGVRKAQVPWMHLVGVEMLPRGTTVGLEPDCCGAWKIVTIPDSAFEGEGFNLGIKSMGRYEADKDHISLGGEAITTTTKVVIGDKTTIETKIMKKNRAVVNRCPSALGIVPGNAVIYEELGYSLATPETNSRAGIFAHDQAKTEAQTDVEGLVQEIKLEITAADLDSETGQIVRQSSGHAVKKRDMPVVCSGCNTRVAEAAKRLGRMASWNYYNAELKWRKPEHNADACVKIHFKPATKTVTLSPGASTKVNAQLRTVAGDQATEGRLFELQELKDGKVTPQDEKTAPQSPAVFTFTAPNRRWSKSAVPGFRVFNSSSRAGRAEPEEWALADAGLRLRIEDEIGPGMPRHGWAQFRGTVQFEILLEPYAEGWFRGIVTVVRPLEVFHERGIAHYCVGHGEYGGGSWEEEWIVTAHVDPQSESMTVQFGFTTSNGQASWTCYDPIMGVRRENLAYIRLVQVLHSLQMSTKTGATKNVEGRSEIDDPLARKGASEFLERLSMTVLEGLD